MLLPEGATGDGRYARLPMMGERDVKVRHRALRDGGLRAARDGAGSAVPVRLSDAGDRDQRRYDPRARRRHRSGGRPAARLWRDRRHVGAAGGRPGARPHGGRARPARLGLSVEAGRRLRQEDPGRRRGGRARCAQDRARRSRHARHRQHGRLRLRRAAPASA